MVATMTPSLNPTVRLCQSLLVGERSYNSDGRDYEGPEAIKRAIRDACGVVIDDDGPRLSETQESGPEKGKKAINPDKFISLNAFCAEMMGGEFARKQKMEHEIGEVRRALAMEDTATQAVGPGTFGEVSGWKAGVTGLIEAKIIAGITKSKLVGQTLCPRTTTLDKVRSTKMIGLGRIGDQARKMGIKDSYPMASFDERYLWTPETELVGLGCAVHEDAMHFDMTNQIMRHAESVGEEVSLYKEKAILRVHLGLVNPYNYRGVSYSTYISTGGSWKNMFPSTELVDKTQLRTIRKYSNRNVDPEAGEPIDTEFNVLWCTPNIEEVAKEIMVATEIEQRTQSSTEIRRGPVSTPKYDIISSKHIEPLLTAAGVALADAEDYWGLINTQRAMMWVENWPMRTRHASPQELMMIQGRTAFAVFVDYRGVAMVEDPRYMALAKPSAGTSSTID